MRAKTLPSVGVGSWRGEQAEGQAGTSSRSCLATLEQPAGRDDQAATPGRRGSMSSFNVKAGNDRLARDGSSASRSRKPERGPLDQFAVDGLDLVRANGTSGRRVHREHRVRKRPQCWMRSASARARLKAPASAVRSYAGR